MRILHAPSNPAGQASALVAALRRLGHDAELWQYGEHGFGYPADRTIPITGDPKVPWRTFAEAVERFDVVHLHFGRSLFPDWPGVPPLWDVPLYRVLGVKLFHTWHGSDCRIRRIHLEANPWSHLRGGDVRADDDRTEKVIAILRTYCERTFVTAPDYLDYVPDAQLLPRAVDLEAIPERAPDQRDAPIVLHVPSRRATKGTEHVLRAVEDLRREGLRFDFRLLEGVPHDEVLAAIGDADVVIDNVITGDYELVSIEAMALSRVAVANRLEPSLEAFPDAPVWNVDPERLSGSLATLIRDADLRRDLASRGREYVARRHDANALAPTLVEAYRRAPRPVEAWSLPDWVSLAPARRIELLEQELREARWHEADYRRRLGLPVDFRVRRSLKDRLPMGLRLVLRQWRARVTRAIRR